MILLFPLLSLLVLGAACSALGCLVPLAAIAAAAAMHLPRRASVLVVGAVWFTGQVTGFGLHGYPHDATTIAWGAVLGLACLVALVAARRFARNPALAFGAAFGAYELVLVAASTVLGGWGAYAPAVLISVLLVNAAWFALVHLSMSFVRQRSSARTAV